MLEAHHHQRQLKRKGELRASLSQFNPSVLDTLVEPAQERLTKTAEQVGNFWGLDQSFA